MTYSLDTIESIESINYNIVYFGKSNFDKWICDTWLFTINGQSFEYRTGLGLRKNDKPQRPKLADLLYAVIMDSNLASDTFDNFCDNLGYDTDSKALDIYLQCQENGKKLQKALDSKTIKSLENLLQDY